MKELTVRPAVPFVIVGLYNLQRVFAPDKVILSAARKLLIYRLNLCAKP